MTPAQRERLEELRARAGRPVETVAPAARAHFSHAHWYAGGWWEPCVCELGCVDCPGSEGAAAITHAFNLAFKSACDDMRRR